MPNESDIKKVIREEEEWWDSKIEEDKVDFRLRKKRPKPLWIWDDPELDDIIRGEYRGRLLHPSNAHGLRIFELGCGMGWLTLELARQGHNVDSCDISGKRIEFADAYYKRIKKNEKGIGNVRYFQGDLNTIDLQKNTYDLVVCWDSLHHVIEIERLTQQVFDSLKPGGKLLANDEIGNYSQIVTLINLIFFGIVTLIFKPITLVSLVFEKFKSCIKRRSKESTLNRSVETETQIASPLDGVTGKEMLDYIIKIFGKNNVKYETATAFGPTWLPRIRGPKAIRLSIASLVMKIDRFLIKKGIVKGASAYVEATKA
jgi:2-polyprenyl-3-methyl-5-hydroxy-6-metoxy-1,4-benzoquinol methylase